MGSLFKRSGIGVAQITEAIPWRADAVYQVGVGDHYGELEVLSKGWPGVKFFGCDPRPCKDYPGQFYQVAITNCLSTAMLNIKAKHGDGSSLLPIPGQPNAKQITVLTETLDNLFGIPDERRILLWLDCEGSEPEAIRGGVDFLRYVEVVNIEHSAAMRVANGGRQSVEVYKLLAAAGFWLIDNHTMRVQEGQCDYIYVREHLFRPDLCLSPQELIRWEETHK